MDATNENRYYWREISVCLEEETLAYGNNFFPTGLLEGISNWLSHSYATWMTFSSLNTRPARGTLTIQPLSYVCIPPVLLLQNILQRLSQQLICAPQPVYKI